MCLSLHVYDFVAENYSVRYWPQRRVTFHSYKQKDIMWCFINLIPEALNFIEKTKNWFYPFVNLYFSLARYFCNLVNSLVNFTHHFGTQLPCYNMLKLMFKFQRDCYKHTIIFFFLVYLLYLYLILIKKSWPNKMSYDMYIFLKKVQKDEVRIVTTVHRFLEYYW